MADAVVFSLIAGAVIVLVMALLVYLVDKYVK